MKVSSLPGRAVLAVALLLSSGGLGAVVASPAYADTRTSIVDTAKSQLGHGPCNPGYLSSCGQDWCADFAKWVWMQNGVDVDGLNPLAASFKQYGLDNGTWHPIGDGYLPRPGDAVSFNYTGNGIHHVALVASVNSVDDIVEIGGNQGNGDWSQNRVTSYHVTPSTGHVVGYTSPANLPDTPAPPPPSATVLVSQHIADIDGDGKPDVLGLNAGSADSLWVIPNTSTPGAPSRGASVHLSDGWSTVFNFMLSDFDGDGKIDIVARHDDDLVVWRNTSTVGHPAFAFPGVILSNGWHTLTQLLIADVTGDGKPDIGGWNTGDHDQFWVIPNASTPGNPGRGPSIHVTDGWRTVDTKMLADYDGDGKVDLLGRGGDNLAVWRNTGTNGHPSFAPLVVLSNGWNSLGKLMIADFTGDSKPDIAGYDRATGDQLWVIPNGSTPGNISRDPSIHVSDGWATVSHFMLADWDTDGKTDIIGRHDDDLAIWRNTGTNGKPSIIAPGTVLGSGWGTIGTFLTQQ